MIAIIAIMILIAMEGEAMTPIRPVSDLRNKFTEISRDVHESGEPVFLTRNGVGDMVVMSLDTYEALEFDSSVYASLKEAEREAETTNTRYSTDEVLAAVRDALSVADETHELAHV